MASRSGRGGGGGPAGGCGHAGGGRGWRAIAHLGVRRFSLLDGLVVLVARRDLAREVVVDARQPLGQDSQVILNLGCGRGRAEARVGAAAARARADGRASARAGSSGMGRRMRASQRARSPTETLGRSDGRRHQQRAPARQRVCACVRCVARAHPSPPRPWRSTGSPPPASPAGPQCLEAAKGAHRSAQPRARLEGLCAWVVRAALAAERGAQ